MQNQSKDQDIERFSENFFRTIGCKTELKDGKLLVEDVPKKFEIFVGKKGPYQFVFSPEFQKENCELLVPGGFFLSAMSRFLSSRSKKTLLKLKNTINPQEEILNRFTFHNAEIEDVKVQENYESIFRFAFSSTFQYRNGKKQESYSIYTKDGKIINLNFLEHQFEETNQKLAKFDDLTKEYDLAKEELKKIVSSKTESISKDLRPLLEKEIRRVKDHYSHQVEDAEEEIRELEKQIAQAEKKLIKCKDEEREKINKKIETLKKNLSACLAEDKVEKLKKEMNFVIEDEKYKHGLNVTNKLINTSIIFIPQYIFNVKLKTSYGSAKIQIHYDPLQKYSPPLITDFLKKETYKAYICAAGKICLKEELQKCVEDEKLYSKSEMQTVCRHYNKPVYHKNSGRCSLTGKTYSKSYLRTDEVTKKPVYLNLLIRCPATGLSTVKENLRPCPNCKTPVVPSAVKVGFGEKGVMKYCACCKK